MADRRPPQWASRQRIVRRSPLTRLRDFTPARPADVVPTLVLPPQAGHDSCIVDYSSAQSQMQTILRRRARAPLRARLDRRHAGDQGRDDRRLPGRGATPRCSRRAAAAASTSWATARAAGWPTIYAALHPERVNTLTIAGAPIDFHAGDAVIHESVAGAQRRRPVLLPGPGRARATACSRASSCSAASSSSSRRTRSASSCSCWRNVRDARHVERYRAFEDWFKHTQDIAGPFYLWLVEHLFRDNELIGGTLTHRRRRGRPRTHRLPRQPARRRHRPHHAARAGLRAGRRRLHARRAASRGARRRAATSGCSWAPRRCATTGRS